MSQIRLLVRPKPSDVMRRTLAILERELTERAGIECTDAPTASLTLELDLQEDIGREGFSIVDGDEDSTLRIIGNDERGLLYGIGKFLRSSTYQPAFSPSQWRGTSVPEKPVRAIYFASHFHNFYHDAPIEEVERYIEELALWGCNTLMVWFDMHHYTGIDDPEAIAMIRRLRRLLSAARSVGMSGGLVGLANEAYSTTPEAVRADWTAGHDGYHTGPGGHYHVEICPSKPGGLDLILQHRRELLEAFRDLPLDYFWIWPYDQGGCTCSECTPWGANGFLKVAEPEAALIRTFFPKAKIVLSTWYFDRFIEGEWAAFAAACKAAPLTWSDYLLADDCGGMADYILQKGVPGNLPLVTFPEISMSANWPWGGFGALPRPIHWQKYWTEVSHLIEGVFPYSEGLHEDMNKVALLQLCWDPSRPVDDILREYAAYEFSLSGADDVLQAAHLMESIAVQTCANKEGFRQAASGEAVELYTMPGVERVADACFELVLQAGQTMSEQAQTRWRWRMFWLRAALMKELHDSGMKATPTSESYFSELTTLYHAQNAEDAVCLPSVHRMMTYDASDATAGQT